MSAQEPGFDRLRRRGATASQKVPLRVDPQGRQSLYSVSEQQPPTPGAVTVEVLVVRRGERGDAPAAGQPRTAVGAPAVRRRDHPSWMRCPACSRRTWVKVVIAL